MFKMQLFLNRVEVGQTLTAENLFDIIKDFGITVTEEE